VNHHLESRMRENRPYGSEGGGAGTTGSSYPYPEQSRLEAGSPCRARQGFVW